MSDLSSSARTLSRNLGFSSVAVITLALGIGANTAIFSVVKAVLLNQLPYRQPDRLVMLAQKDSNSAHNVRVGFTTVYDWRRLSHSFESMSLIRDGGGAIVEQGEPELLNGLRVNYDYFDTLGVRMQLGRTFLPSEDRPDTRHVLILSDGLWKRRFGGDPHILGRTVRLSDASFTVIGVLPRGFRPVTLGQSSEEQEIFAPLGYALNEPFACRDCQHLRAIARLKPGVSPAAAHAELSAIMHELVKQYPQSYPSGSDVALAPLQDQMVGRVKTALWLLLGAVGFVLLIACANVANLVLARTTGRAKEMALRAALGASRWRLMRPMLAESLILAAIGGAAGILLAYWGTAALTALGPREIPRVDEIRLDGTVLAFGFAASVLTGLLFGIAPALRASRIDPQDALQGLGKSTAGRSRRGVRNLLVTAELALAFVLVAGAGLLGKSFLRLMNVDPGYDPRHVVTLNTYVYGKRYQKPEVELNYYRQALEKLRAMPAIESAAMVSVLPMDSFDRAGFNVQDQHLIHESEVPFVDRYSVSPDYFRVMKISLKSGRVFTAQDSAGAPMVAIVSESCARKEFPHESAIGKHIQLGGRHDDRPWATIVGVVGDVRQYALDRPATEAAYIPQAQDVTFRYQLVARTTLDPRRMENAVRDAFLDVDRTLPVFKVRPLDSYLAATLAERTFTLQMLGLFGALALALAAVGIYGVISYTVSQRTREIGIRVALGAERSTVLGLVLRQGLTLICAGLAAGFAASLGLNRLLSSLLFEVHPIDLATSAAVAATLAIVALTACYIPALRAARVDPIVALRYE